MVAPSSTPVGAHIPKAVYVLLVLHRPVRSAIQVVDMFRSAHVDLSTLPDWSIQPLVGVLGELRLDRGEYLGRKHPKLDRRWRKWRPSGESSYRK
jgi:hypothetical protein